MVLAILAAGTELLRGRSLLKSVERLKSQHFLSASILASSHQTGRIWSHAEDSRLSGRRSAIGHRRDLSPTPANETHLVLLQDTNSWSS
jgi:hypothetical protein